MDLGPLTQKLLKLSTILASLVLAAWGLDCTEKYYPGFLGMHGVNIFPLFPLYAVACFYLLDFLLSWLTRPGAAVGARVGPVKRFSSLPLVSLILSTAGFFLPFVSIGGILAGHAARRKDKAGQHLRGMGMATVGLITGYSFLAIWVYMVIVVGFLYTYAMLFDRR